MKISQITLFPILLISLSALGQERVEQSQWVWHGPKGSDAFVSLKTVRAGNEVKFHLELNRGAPSYNLGIASGEFTIKDYLGVYEQDDYGNCTLIFVFVGNKVQVKQVESESGTGCGFGFGVYANHILKKM